MREGWNVIIRHDPAFRGTNIWFIKHNADGSADYISPVSLVTVHSIAPNEITPEPTLTFSGDVARDVLTDMANALIEAGFRPDELKASDETLQATQDHLEDMRTLVMQLMPKSAGQIQYGIKQ